MMPQRSGSTFRGSTVILAALAIVAVVVAAVFSVTALANRRIAVEAAEHQTHNLSAAVAMHAEQLFQRIDTALQGIERDMVPLHPLGEAAPQKGFDILAARAQASSSVLAFVILDSTGRVAFTSRTPNPEKVNLSDREYFTIHRQGAGAGLHIDAPVLGRVGFSKGRWIVPASRRLTAIDGTFAGVVAAIVDVSSLTRFYDSIHLESGAEILLARRDGTVLAQRSQSGQRLGTSLATAKIFRDMVPRMEHGTNHGALFDNVPLIASFSTAPSYPAVAVVASSLPAVLAPWKRATLEAGTITFLLLAGLCAAGAYLIKLIKRGETITAEREALAAERDLLMGRLRLQFERMPVGCVIMTTEPALIDLNPAAERIFGYGKSELAGKNLYGLIVPEAMRPYLDGLLTSLDSDQTVQSINENLTRDGRTITCEWFNTPLKDDRGELMAVMAMVRDITEEQRTLAALRESEARYRSLFTGNHAVMLLIDPKNGGIVDANPAACDYYGIPADRLTTMSISQINVADPATIHSGMASAKTGERRRFIFRHRLADGVVRDVEVYSGPIVIGGRELLYSIIFDITDKMAAEEEIRRLTAHLEDRVRERTAQLEAANKELEAFSYSVSHDLRAPLRHVAGFVELLLKRNSDGLDEKSRHYLDVIGDSTRRMGSLIDDLLAFSRMGRVDMITAPLDLNRIVREVIASRETDNGQREIEWVVGTLPPARGDETMIRLVFENLIDNAVKFSAVRDRARIEIGGYLDSEGTPVAFVRDNGAGFDMRYEDKLFGLFQRLHRQEEFEGTGVGLANVRRIVHRHGGRVWAEGALDKGATFYLTLPPHKEAAL